ncbi:MAG: hypothetical protein AAFO76_11545 [Cyanobacteria bacterium J06607_15]
MNHTTKHSQPNVASLLLLSLVFTGSICLWRDREANSFGYSPGDRLTEVQPHYQAQVVKEIRVNSPRRLSRKIASLLP